MDGITVPYEEFFKIGKPVKVGIHLAENILLEDHAAIMSLEGNRLKLELWGAGLAEKGGAKAGADVTIVSDSGYSVYRCSASLETETFGRIVTLVLSGGIREKQLREHFRFDVSLPIVYSIPENQTLISVKSEWQMNKIRHQDLPPPLMERHENGFKVMKWNDLENLMPERVNLSGGGLRFRMPEFMEPGTLMLVDLFLPLIPPRVISVVTEVLRCNEMMLFWTRGNFYSTAMRFHCIEEKDRETIISHIFMEQRRSLQVVTTL
jgi:hypothetical protein